MLDGYSNGLEEKGFGMSFTIDIADFVPKIFEELDSMWTKRPQSLGSYRDEMEICEVSVLVDSAFSVVLQDSSADVWQ